MSDQTGNPVPGFDTRHAHPTRVYNYWLGGTDNYPADREMAEMTRRVNERMSGPQATMRDRAAITRRSLPGSAGRGIMGVRYLSAGQAALVW